MTEANSANTTTAAAATDATIATTTSTRRWDYHHRPNTLTRTGLLVRHGLSFEQNGLEF